MKDRASSQASSSRADRGGIDVELELQEKAFDEAVPKKVPAPSSRPLAQILGEYDAQREEREQFVRDLTGVVAERLKEAGIETALVEGRVKETHSYARHLANRPTDERQDLTALRAVLLYAAQTEAAVSVISSLFGETPDCFRDESDSKDDLQPWEFAYRSRHLKFKPTDSFKIKHGILASEELMGEWAEIQVRSLAAHLWSAIDHKIRYKTPFPLENDEARSLFMVAAQLEAIDRELDSIHSSLANRVDAVGLGVLAGSYDHEVSADGIRAMIYSDPDVVRLLAIAQTHGWKFLSRDGHEHLEGGYVGSPAEANESESCESLRSVVANDGIRQMRALREEIVAIVTPAAVTRLSKEAREQGLAAITYPADLIALIYQVAHPTPQAKAYVLWQAAIAAMRADIQSFKGS